MGFCFIRVDLRTFLAPSRNRDRQIRSGPRFGAQRSNADELDIKLS